MSEGKPKLKVCSGCKEPLPLNEFTKDRSTSDGLKCACKACRSRRGKEYRKNNQSLALYQKKYRFSNKKIIAEKYKVWQTENKDRVAVKGKQYRENNKPEIAQRDKLYREKNKAKLNAKKKIYWKKNREQLRKKKKEYYKENKKQILKSQKEYTKTHKVQKKAYYEKNKKHSSNQRQRKRKELALYVTFADKLGYAENIKVGPADELIVLCAYCNQPFVPTHGAAVDRSDTLAGRKNGEHRFYCSDACKSACPSYRRQVHWKSQKPATSREVSAGFRQLVFERDNWTCQRCGVGIEAELHAHHIEGAVQHPGMSNDLENGITLCKSCHKLVHSQSGCRYVDLRCPTIKTS